MVGVHGHARMHAFVCVGAGGAGLLSPPLIVNIGD